MENNLETRQRGRVDAPDQILVKTRHSEVEDSLGTPMFETPKTKPKREQPTP